MATVKQVLEQVDAMLPNQYTTAEKRRWLLQAEGFVCLLYTSPSPRDRQKSRMPSSA